MNKLSLKSKISFVLFAVFLFIGAVLFNFEQMIFAVISLIIAIIFAVLLAFEHKS